MRFSRRVQSLPPYLFAEIERKVAARRAAGADIISLGIGDPDTPTPAHIVAALVEAAHDPACHQYPSNRGTLEFRTAVAAFYERRFGVRLDPETEVMPLLGAKEGLAHICLALLDQSDVCLAADPGYPVYTTGPLLADGHAVHMPLLAERGFQPDLEAVEPSVLAKAKMVFVGYPNNPTGAVIEDDFFARLVAFAKAHDLLVVHDNAYADITFDGYVAPSFLETPGAKDVGVEFFSLSKNYNMTGWRAGAIVGNRDMVDAFWRLKTNMDSGMFGAVQHASAVAHTGESPACPRARGSTAQGQHLLVGPRARGPHVGELRRAHAQSGRRHRLAGGRLRPQRRGLRPPLLDRARRSPRGGGATHRRPGRALSLALWP
jgi:LL-diaminopimelate aminotransferase